MRKSIISSLTQLPRVRKSRGSILGGLTAVALALGFQLNATAQSDNFDSGTLSAAWTKYQFFPQSYTFPTVGTGKGLRIQAAPVPGAAPAAAAIAQAKVYTDFYVSVDLVNWVIEDQALVLLGRWTPGGAAGLAEGTGMILNYDAAQAGDSAGSRTGGQFQINTVTPGFSTVTLGAADITLEPGRPYRLVFQATGSIYKGQVYDLNDLRTPLATLSADDTVSPAPVAFTSGLVGFLSFSRNGTAGTTDVTIDNFYAAASDPNTAIAPAIHHPLYTVDGSGVPQVASRVPAKRFTNFHPSTSGISFTANTFTAGQVNASATKLYLNGVDVSASLAPFPANGSTASFSVAAGTLQSNTIYAAQIELQDTAGTLKSTNTFWFDTFSDAYIATLKTIEAEDYNYSNGVYHLDPIPVSGLDTNGVLVNGNIALGGNDLGYYGFMGTPEVDYSKPAGNYHSDYSEYRPADRVQITQGSYTTPARDEAGDIVDYLTNVPPQRIQDTQRAKYVAAKVWEYQVRLTSPGDWMNYTRSFTPTNYHVYLRCGSFGSTTVYLDQVTGDPTTTNQSRVRSGSFNVDNHLMRLNYKYEPLMYGSSPAVVSLSGLQTLRLTLGGTVGTDERVIVMDYLLLVPTSDSPTLILPVYPPTIFDNFNDGNDTTPAPAWIHYDPLGDLTVAPPATFAFTNPPGTYQIVAPTPLDCGAGPARVASVRPELYSDFYLSVDLLDWDDTQRQALGLIARASNIGLGTTTGYLWTWELGSGTLPNTTGGGTDISYVLAESPNGVTYPPTQSRDIHLVKGRHYRMTFLGQGTNFTGKIFDITDDPNPAVPILTTVGTDDKYARGQVGLVVASESACPLGGSATFDNFLATTAEPTLTVSHTGGSVMLTWPFIPYRLQSSLSLSSPAWTDVTIGITLSGGQYVYSTPATGSQYYRLIYP